jgi:hypothetical protein
MSTSKRKVRIPKMRETIKFVLVKDAFEVRRAEACARPAVAAGFGSAVMEKKV